MNCSRERLMINQLSARAAAKDYKRDAHNVKGEDREHNNPTEQDTG
jgi:hypothetical protein